MNSIKLALVGVIGLSSTVALSSCSDDKQTSPPATAPKPPAGFKVAVVNVGAPLGALIPEDFTVAEIEPGRVKIDYAGKGSSQLANSIGTLMTVAADRNAERTFIEHWKRSGLAIKRDDTLSNGWLVVAMHEGTYNVMMHRSDLGVTCQARGLPDPGPAMQVCESLATMRK